VTNAVNSSLKLDTGLWLGKCELWELGRIVAH